MKANIKLPISQLTFLGLLNLIRNVIAKLTGNAFFATPFIPLADMTIMANRLEAAIERANKGSELDKSVRNDVVAEVQSMLRAQANYVRAICDGDSTKLLSSGFDMAKRPERRAVPLAPDNITIRATNISHEVEMRWPKREGALGYRVFKTDKDPTTNPVWDYVDFTSRVNFKVRGLESYKPYWFSVTAIGAAGESDLSKAIMGRAA